MSVGARLSVPDLRRAARHSVDHTLVAAHRDRGNVELRIVNISALGFMVADCGPFSRGDRVVVRLPQIGFIEALCVWLADTRAGFQFERVIREDDFEDMLGQLSGACSALPPA